MVVRECPGERGEEPAARVGSAECFSEGEPSKCVSPRASCWGHGAALGLNYPHPIQSSNSSILGWMCGWGRQCTYQVWEWRGCSQRCRQQRQSRSHERGEQGWGWEISPFGSEVSEGCCLKITVEPVGKVSPQSLSSSKKESPSGDAVQTQKRLHFPWMFHSPSAKAFF